MNGKGSKRRPAAVDRKAFEDAWEATFGKLGLGDGDYVAVIGNDGGSVGKIENRGGRLRVVQNFPESVVVLP